MQTPQDHPTRRVFLRRSALAAGAVSSARSASRVIGANDRINVSLIGIGSIGTAHLRTLMPQCEEEKDIQMAAVSEIYTQRKARARDITKLPEKDVHHDYREMLARNDVDVVIIATPDHWHGRMALDALAAGKDVYLQKPMTYTIEEARQIAASAKKLNRIVSVGVQGTSDPRYKIAKEAIGAGEIGELLMAQGNSSRNSLLGEWNWRVEPEGTVETIDWKRFLGSAPKRPFSPDRYFRWRKYWDYSGGIATDLFYHSLSPLVKVMGAQFPTRVSASGGIYVHKDREVPDTYATLIEYPGFCIDLSGSMANSAIGRHHPTIIYGHKGTITFERGQVVVTPEFFPELRRRSAGQKPPEPKVLPVPPPKKWAVDIGGCRIHTENFFACVRSRQAPNLDAETGAMVMTAIRLGVDAYREGKTKLFDPKTQKVADKLPARQTYEGDGKNHTADELKNLPTD
ncbi:MAG: Gfo/Idh/MocA family oxidoreductase [Acidobacteria bacterium]|nr:Gfo/Idh/MocA family oxidoreductase [Acidobacteriota bacterium]